MNIEENKSPSKKTPRRIELKDLRKLRDLESIESSLLKSSLAFYSSYPDRRINSLYFDSDNHIAFDDSLAGHTLRKKIRFRWYGPIENSSAPTLEFKYKHGHLSWKVLQKLNFIIDLKSPNWEEAFLSSLNHKSISSKNYFALSQTKPTSIVSYTRSYYESTDRKVRITLDKDITFRDQSIYPSPNLYFAKHNTENLVFEIKIAEKDITLLDELFRTFDFIPQRYSKYCESLRNHMPK